MSKILVTYASQRGSTREIVEGIGEALRGSGLHVDDIYWINMSSDLGRQATRQYFTQANAIFLLTWVLQSLGRAAASRSDMGSARPQAQEGPLLGRQVHPSTWTSRNKPLLKDLDSTLVSPQSPGEPVSEGFSRRQLEVLRWLDSDLSGPEIADRLVVSLNTVRFHTKNIYQKLGVNTRLGAIRRAKELGL